MAGSGILYPKLGGGGGVIVVANPKPRSSDGWTDPDYYADFDTRRVYVAADAADDTANGLTPLTPKKTLAAGRALLRAGFPDQLLLKRGGTWTDQNLQYFTANGQSNGQPLSGRNANARMVLGTRTQML